MGTDRVYARYRFYDAAGGALYFGSAAHPELRWRQHRKAAWWAEVDPDRTIVDWYPSQREAERAEYDAIRSERPRVNKNGNPDHARRQRGDRAGWWDYVQDITGGATHTAIAEKAGLSHGPPPRARSVRR